jgi:hypothetical protein
LRGGPKGRARGRHGLHRSAQEHVQEAARSGVRPQVDGPLLPALADAEDGLRGRQNGAQTRRDAGSVTRGDLTLANVDKIQGGICSRQTCVAR